MAEFVVKIADDRGRVQQHIEQGYSEAEVRDRFSQQGYLVYWVKPQGMLTSGVSLHRRRKLKQNTFLVFNQQFLTLIRAGLPILNSLELLIKRQKDAQLRQILENVQRPGEGRRVALRCVRGAGDRAQDLHHHADGGREERQRRRGADALHHVSAAGDDLPQEVVCFADLSHAAGDRGPDHGDVSVHLRGAEVCGPVQQPGCEAAFDYGVHAGRWA